MKSIKFRTREYMLVDEVNVSPTRLQCTIEKGNNTFDSIAESVFGVEEILVLENGETVAIYNGYTTRIAITLYANNTISIELGNTNVLNQIDVLTNSVNNVWGTMDTLQDNVNTLNTSVEELTPYTETKTAYYNESEKTFYNVPEGDISVFFDNYNGDYSINRVVDRVIVSFDTLQQSTNIIISVN